MSTLALLEHEREPKVMVLSKGAPEKMLEFYKKESITEDYEETFKHYSRLGCRVIALGYKYIKYDIVDQVWQTECCDKIN